MSVFKDIPGFSKYKMDVHGIIVRKSDDYKPYVALDFKVNLYDDNGVQKEYDAQKGINELFRDEARAISYGAPLSLPRRMTSRAASVAPIESTVLIPVRQRTEGQTHGGVERSDEQMFPGYNQMMELNIFKHFKAYILRSKGYQTRAIARFLFNNNSGAARNAEILYRQRPAIVRETAKMLKRRMGESDYLGLRRTLGYIDGSGVFILPINP